MKLFSSHCHTIFQVAVLSLSLASCNPQDAGNLFDEEEPTNGTALAVLSVTRSSVDEPSAFPLGAVLRIHASGALAIDGGALVLGEQGWYTAEPYVWTQDEDVAHIVVLYPWMERYDAASLYDAEGNLTDLLCQVDDFPAGQGLSLLLQHRFARVVVEMDAQAQARVAKLDLKVPARVVEVSAATGNVAVDEGQCAVASRSLDGSEDRVAFIVPAGVELELQLVATDCHGTEERIALDPMTLEANTSYPFRLLGGE